MKGKISIVSKYAVMFLTAVVLVVCSNMKNITAQAEETYPVSDIAQKGIDKTSIKVTWTPAIHAVSYHVYYSLSETGGGNKVLFQTVNQSECTITGLLPGKVYNITIESCSDTGKIASASRMGFVTMIDQLTGLNQDKSQWMYGRILKVDWDSIIAADGYEIGLYDNKNKRAGFLDMQNEGASFYNMKDKVYTVKARAYMTYEGQKYYTPWSSMKCLNQAKIKSVKVSGNKLNVKWGKVEGVTGYNIYISTKKNSGYKKAAAVKKNSTSYTVKKLQGKKFSAKKKYYVYVETVYNTKGSKNASGGLYWSSQNGQYGYIQK